MTTPIKLSSPATHQFWEIPVLHEDEHLLALDKPCGVLTSPAPDEPDQPSLLALLRAGIAEGKGWATERGLTYLTNVYRLDFETSGVLLLAKSRPVLVKLADFLGSDKPCQKYLALVQGVPQEDGFQVEAKLASFNAPFGPVASAADSPGLPPDVRSGGETPAAPAGESAPALPGRTLRMRVDPKHGKHALTRVQVRERFNGWTLVECEPLTARPHQVRVHLRHAGLPVVGDSLYGGRPLWLSRLKPGYRLKPNKTERPLIGQAALHLAELAFPHPVTGEPVVISAPWPKDLTVAVKYLRRYRM
jgi:23S rRNA-/tRNA-specific pseudouridylate synthase